MLLVMGYQGRAAFRLKEAYIMAFNAMETELRTGMAHTRGLATDALLALCAEASRCGYQADFVPQLVRYRRLGLSQKEIGRLLTMGKDAVGYWLQKCQRAGLELPLRTAGSYAAKVKSSVQKSRQLSLLPGVEVL